MMKPTRQELGKSQRVELSPHLSLVHRTSNSTAATSSGTRAPWSSSVKIHQLKKSWQLIDEVSRFEANSGTVDSVEAIAQVNAHRSDLINQMTAVNRIYSVKLEQQAKENRSGKGDNSMLSSSGFPIGVAAAGRAKSSSQPNGNGASTSASQDQDIQSLNRMIETATATAQQLQSEVDELDSTLSQNAFRVSSEPFLSETIARLKREIEEGKQEILDYKEDIEKNELLQKQEHGSTSSSSKLGSQNRAEFNEQAMQETRKINALRKENEILKAKHAELDEKLSAMLEQKLFVDDSLQKVQSDLDSEQEKQSTSQAAKAQQLAAKIKAMKEKESATKNSILANKKAEYANVDKYNQLLSSLASKNTEKDEYLDYFDQAVDRATEELVNRCKLATVVDRSKFNAAFPIESRKLDEVQLQAEKDEAVARMARLKTEMINDGDDEGTIESNPADHSSRRTNPASKNKKLKTEEDRPDPRNHPMRTSMQKRYNNPADMEQGKYKGVKNRQLQPNGEIEYEDQYIDATYQPNNSVRQHSQQPAQDIVGPQQQFTKEELVDAIVDRIMKEKLKPGVAAASAVGEEIVPSKSPMRSNLERINQLNLEHKIVSKERNNDMSTLPTTNTNPSGERSQFMEILPVVSQRDPSNNNYEDPANKRMLKRRNQPEMNGVDIPANSTSSNKAFPNSSKSKVQGANTAHLPVTRIDGKQQQQQSAGLGSEQSSTVQATPTNANDHSNPRNRKSEFSSQVESATAGAKKRSTSMVGQSQQAPMVLPPVSRIDEPWNPKYTERLFGGIEQTRDPAAAGAGASRYPKANSSFSSGPFDQQLNRTSRSSNDQFKIMKNNNNTTDPEFMRRNTGGITLLPLSKGTSSANPSLVNISADFRNGLTPEIEDIYKNRLNATSLLPPQTQAAKSALGYRDNDRGGVSGGGTMSALGGAPSNATPSNGNNTNNNNNGRALKRRMNSYQPLTGKYTELIPRSSNFEKNALDQAEPPQKQDPIEVADPPTPEKIDKTPRIPEPELPQKWKESDDRIEMLEDRLKRQKEMHAKTLAADEAARSSKSPLARKESRSPVKPISPVKEEEYSPVREKYMFVKREDSDKTSNRSWVDKASSRYNSPTLGEFNEMKAKQKSAMRGREIEQKPNDPRDLRANRATESPKYEDNASNQRSVSPSFRNSNTRSISPQFRNTRTWTDKSLFTPRLSNRNPTSVNPV